MPHFRFSFMQQFKGAHEWGVPMGSTAAKAAAACTLEIAESTAGNAAPNWMERLIRDADTFEWTTIGGKATAGLPSPGSAMQARPSDLGPVLQTPVDDWFSDGAAEPKACGCDGPCEHDHQDPGGHVHGPTMLDPAAEQMLLAAEQPLAGVAADDLERMMLDLINAERAKAGVAPLVLERVLNAAAEDHSEWMVDNRTISHRGEGGSTPRDRMEAAGFDFAGSTATAENIAVQSLRGAPGLADDVQDLHERLMASPGHRATLLSDRYEYIGLGIEAGNGLIFATQKFARTSGEVVPDLPDAPDAPSPAPTPSPTPTPPATVLKAYLIDAATDERLGEIRDGESIEIGDADPRNLSIVVESDVADVESVRIMLDGRGRTENFEPYALFGDRRDSDGGRDIAGGVIGLGEKTLVVSAYDQNRAQGQLIETRSLTFTVLEAAPQPDPEPEPEPDPEPTPPSDAFTAFLVNAANDQIIGEIRDGQQIDIGDASADNLSVMVETEDARVESIRITVDGVSRIESREPYVLFADVPGRDGARDILGGDVGLGQKTLVFTAYDEDVGRGAVLGNETLTFTLVDEQAPPESDPVPDPTPVDPTPPTDPFEDGVLTRYTSGGDPETSFNIDINFEGGGWTEGIQRAFVRGAEFLSNVIIDDVQGRDGVDDVVMNVSLYDGGRGGTLASAGPRGTNPDGTTSVGAARFDRVDALWLEDTLLDDIVVHEFFHALGSGTRPNAFEFATYTFNQEFPELSGGNATTIPFSGGHLSEAVFDNELNTPTIDAQNYLSDTSVAILEDLGYDTYLDNVFDPNDKFGPAPENTVTELAVV